MCNVLYIARAVNVLSHLILTKKPYEVGSIIISVTDEETEAQRGSVNRA